MCQGQPAPGGEESPGCRGLFFFSKLYVDHGGKRIYVCCKGCIAPVKKDAGKYIKALEADGVTLETVNPKKS